MTTQHAAMLYDAGRKSVGLAYALWFFTGAIGGHRFYLGHNWIGVMCLALFTLGWIGFPLVMLPVAVVVLCDLFLIPSMIRDQNTALAESLAGENIEAA